MQAEDIRKQAEKAVTLLKALGSHNRLMIACQLVEGERSVGELANLLEIGETVVSQHLSLMRKDGLVAARRDGRCGSSRPPSGQQRCEHREQRQQ